MGDAPDRVWIDSTRQVGDEPWLRVAGATEQAVDTEGRPIGAEYVHAGIAAAKTREATAELRAEIAVKDAAIDRRDAYIGDLASRIAEHEATIADLRAQLASIRTAADAQRAREAQTSGMCPVCGMGHTGSCPGLKGLTGPTSKGDWYGQFTHPPEPYGPDAETILPAIIDTPLFGSDVDA